MLVAALLVPLVVLVTRVVAGPTAGRDSGSRLSLSISRQINDASKRDIIQRDRKHRKKDGQQDSSSTPVLNVSDTGIVYVVNVGVGEPPAFYDLIIDIAGANTWVGTGLPYKMTSSSVKTGDTVSVQYTSGSYLKGSEYLDAVTLASGLAISQQSIGVADPVTSSVEGFYPFDGVLGIGPNILSVGTLDPDKSDIIHTVTDNLFAQVNSTAYGEMTFGDTDPSKYTGDITYFPTTTVDPANKYWGVDASFRFGNDLVILNNAAGVLDTITNLILIPTDAYNSYASATGGVLDQGTDLLSITPTQYQNLPSLFFDIGGTTYEITKNAQIYPREWNAAIGGTSDGIYLVVQDIKYSRLSGMGFILGRPFLERFYTVFDSYNSKVGFATTQFTDAETN